MKNETAKVETIDLLETAGYSAIVFSVYCAINTKLLYSDSQLADGELVAW